MRPRVLLASALLVALFVGAKQCAEIRPVVTERAMPTSPAKPPAVVARQSPPPAQAAAAVEPPDPIPPDAIFPPVGSRASSSVTFVRAGAPKLALDEIDDLLRVEPDSPAHHYWRAVANAALGEKEVAVGDLKRAVALSPSHLSALSYAGKLALELGRAEESVGYLTALIRQAPQYGGGYAHAMRGEALVAYGDVKDAITDFKAACGQGDGSSCMRAQQLARPSYSVLGWQEVGDGM